MLKKLLFIFLLITIFSVPSYAIELKEYKNNEIIIKYEPNLEGAAMNISNAYPEIRTIVEKRLGWKADFVPIVVLISKKEVFQEMARNELITAYAVPGKNIIVMGYAKLDRTSVDLQSTFEHELYHLLLHNNIKNSKLPKWLNEGVAQWASGGIADIINPEKKDILKQAVLSDKLLPLSYIDTSFPAQPRKLILSYQESKSIVEYIVNKHGENKLLGVLNSLKNGDPIEKAIYKNLSIDLNALEQEWKKSLVRKYSWASYMASNIYWILFVLAAVITIIGYLRFRIRLKNYRDEDEDIPFYE